MGRTRFSENEDLTVRSISGDGSGLYNLQFQNISNITANNITTTNIQVNGYINGYTVADLASGGIANLPEISTIGSSKLVAQNGATNNVISVSNIFNGTVIQSNIETAFSFVLGPYSIFYEPSGEQLIFSKNGQIKMSLSDN